MPQTIFFHELKKLKWIYTNNYYATTTTRTNMDTLTQTYKGNKTYDAVFTNWFNNWFSKTAANKNWKCDVSYVSDQEKEKLFVAFYNMKVLERNIVNCIVQKLSDKTHEFPNRLEEFKRKYNIADLDDHDNVTKNLLFEAFFKDDEDKIQNIAKIAKMQEKLKQEIEHDDIDEWFEQHDFSVKDLLKITSLATKKLQ